MSREQADGDKRDAPQAKEAVHISEQDRADLERFRAAMAKLNAKQQNEVNLWMLGIPDIQ